VPKRRPSGAEEKVGRTAAVVVLYLEASSPTIVVAQVPVLEALKPGTEALAEDLEVLGTLHMPAPGVVCAVHVAGDREYQCTGDQIGDLERHMGVAVTEDQRVPGRSGEQAAASPDSSMKHMRTMSSMQLRPPEGGRRTRRAWHDSCVEDALPESQGRARLTTATGQSGAGPSRVLQRAPPISRAIARGVAGWTLGASRSDGVGEFGRDRGRDTLR
jgi:hypothetical protein